MELQLSNTAFWDTALQSMNEKQHADFIITRVFQYGLINDIRAVLRFYNREEIIRAFKNRRGVDIKAIRLAAVAIDAQKELLE